MTIRTSTNHPETGTQGYIATAEQKTVSYEVSFGEFWEVQVQQQKLGEGLAHIIHIRLAPHLLAVENHQIKYVHHNLQQNPFLQLKFSKPITQEDCTVYLSSAGRTGTHPREQAVRNSLHNETNITLSCTESDRLTILPKIESGEVTFEVMSGHCVGETVTVQWDQETQLPQVSVQSPNSP